ncbi:TPM domain-containing protein [Phenylobacterium sp.]|uniref:TPM domain-containing protein n=1 Tax=Phenylobacterium sp. TaxID=1871053 RepID=UPI002735B6A0|nr:TPM domain-containing protein [Phenylobacterium sp.]MDP3855993.1 TPM domain-containing protein [Phenylobacterium sp.]
MLNETDRARIEAAIHQAEARTSGEIYCVVAQESSDYLEVPLAWAAMAALVAPAVLLTAGIHVTVPELGQGWTAAQMSEAAETAARAALSGAILLQGALFVAVAIIAALPPVRRLLTPRALKRHRVRRRAHEQFLAKSLQATRERTGVLIYVSIDEHMAELIADEGIAAKVDGQVWQAAMSRLIEGFKTGRPAEGFEAAIGLCVDILAEHFPARAGDNPNELPDKVVLLP